MPTGPDRFLLFELSRETTLAWYYVVARWSNLNWSSAPRLQLIDGPMRISVRSDQTALSEIRALLTQGRMVSTEMEASANALLAVIDAEAWVLRIPSQAEYEDRAI